MSHGYPYHSFAIASPAGNHPSYPGQEPRHSYPIASPAGNHPYPGQEPRTPSVSGSYHGVPGGFVVSTPTIRNGANASITSSLASTVGGENRETIISVSLGQPGNVQLDVFEATLQKVREAFVDNAYGPSPSIETLDQNHVLLFQNQYLNDLGHKARVDCAGFNDQGSKSKRRLQNQFSNDMQVYVQLLQALASQCTEFIDRNGKFDDLFAQSSELSVIAKKRMEEVKALLNKVQMKQEALEMFEQWQYSGMEGDRPGLQDTLQVVEAIHGSFTFPTNVTVFSRLDKILKDDLEKLGKQLVEIADSCNDLNIVCAALQQILAPFSNICDTKLKDETLHSYYWLLYTQIMSIKFDLFFDFSAILREAHTMGLIHPLVSVYKLDRKSRIKQYEWYKCFAMVIFGSFGELEGILAQKSKDGKKAVLATKDEAMKGNWFIFLDTQTEQNQAVSTEDMNISL